MSKKIFIFRCHQKLSMKITSERWYSFHDLAHRRMWMKGTIFRIFWMFETLLWKAVMANIHPSEITSHEKKSWKNCDNWTAAIIFASLPDIFVRNACAPIFCIIYQTTRELKRKNIVHFKRMYDIEYRIH